MNMKAIVLGAILVAGPTLAACSTCETIARSIQTEYGIPDNLLLGIVRAESGAHPWTVNVEGEGSYHASKAAALDYVRAQVSAGRRSIDVGCAQINLRWHPQAFDTLQAGFDPQTNIEYAAEYLLRLWRRVGDWGGAVAGYHSPSDPERGRAYAEKVFQAAGQGSARATISTRSSRAPEPDLSHQTKTATRTSQLEGAIGNLR